MCVILILAPGVMPLREKLNNAVHNNPHGFGLILKDADTNKLEVIRRFHENGTDPEEVWDLLEENKALHRVLHIRWKTEGEISLDNVQPFCVYKTENREIWFAHNGTLSDFKDTIQVTEGTVTKTVPGPRSDTRKFAEDFLSPLLLRMEGPEGKADIQDGMLQSVIEKFWTYASTGVLVASDQDDFMIRRSGWKTMKGVDDQEFYSSNDTYYDKVIRGFLFEKLEQEKREQLAKEAQERRGKFQNANGNDSIVSRLVNVGLKERQIVPEDLAAVFDDVDLFKPEGLVDLANLMPEEIVAFVDKDPQGGACLLNHMLVQYAILYGRYDRVRNYLTEKKVNVDELTETAA